MPAKNRVIDSRAGLNSGAAAASATATPAPPTPIERGSRKQQRYACKESVWFR
ncbi:MAG: hypothetical protein WC236_02460 [Gallionellaceae bacterium]